MSIYPSLESLKFSEIVAQNNIAQQNDNLPPNLAICPPHPSNMDEKSLSTLYPILNDYLGLELSALAQKNSVAIPVQEPSAQVTNGVRKFVLCKDVKGHIGLKLSKFNQGIFVNLVIQDSPAAKAGLRFGDQILQINDTFTTGMSIDAVYKIFRECSINNINVIVRDRPLERSVTLYKNHNGSVGFQIKNGKIINIVKDSSAARNGVLIDHQLLEVNGQNVIGMKDKHVVEIFTKSPDMITITIIPESIYNHMIKKISPSLIKNKMDHSII